MKQNYFFTVVLLIIFNSTYSQKEGDIIKLTTYCKVLKVKSIEEKSDSKLNYIGPNISYIINEIGTDTVALKALNFNKKPEQAKKYNNTIYYIDKKEFEKSYEVVERIDKMTVGIITLPFKARPQDGFSFDTEFNLNTTLNWDIIRVYNARFNIQVGTGIGSVNLDSSNSEISDNSAQNIAILSLFSGLMIEYKRVQAGLYFGVDHINNQKNYNWQHNGNVWFGFGIGFNVFGISLGDSQKGQ
ncbi:hypothetical protein SAMN05444372_12118 [Flavobacterium micromati]|uniref:Uncharacterized protein n=1 Tax=Flavobacterium micromati TaxID=229205 RepID=A0A1M5QZN6_9FLAO|nr:hypothetical protein [Flavobacterium micromati]SHH19189.1 hypothetical protein SAMN05444372_12118 [Flavobacterium micromati]